MKRLLISLALCAVSTQAHAATTHRLDATPSLSTVSSMWIDFMDTDNNGILSGLSEVTDFSGVKVFSTTFDILTGVPTIANVSSGPNASWVFGLTGAVGSAGTVAPPGFSTYQITPVSQVPVPASLLSMVGGIGLLGWAGRRRAKAAKRA